MTDIDRVDDFCNARRLIGDRFCVLALQAGGYRSVQVHDPVYCLYFKQIRSFQLRVLPESRLDIGRDLLVISRVRRLREDGAPRQRSRYNQGGNEWVKLLRPRGRWIRTSID